MFYINKKGIVIEALQWGGNSFIGATAEEIEKIFDVQTRVADNEIWLYKDNMFWGRLHIGDYLFVGLIDKLEISSKEQFEKCFTLINDQRVALVEGFKKEMLMKLAARQQKSSWRNEKIEAINFAMLNECQELIEELDKIMKGGKDFSAARRECADVANYAAIQWDLINDMEGNRDDLEKMWDNAESINKGMAGNTYA